MAKMHITFDGFRDLAQQIDRSGGDLKKAVDEALVETGKYVQAEVHNAAAIYDAKGKKGYAKGNMYKSIINNQIVTWQGNVAEVKVGFNFGVKGGHHSIFVMYGTPRISKDTKLYNSIKGVKTITEVEKIQQEVMLKYLKVGG